MPFDVSLACGDEIVLDDARISDRKTISVPNCVLKRLRVGPRGYLRFLLMKTGGIEVRGMALTPVSGTDIERIADERVDDIRNGRSLTLGEIKATLETKRG